MVIEANRYRQKTWTEKLKEAEEIEKILKPKAKEQLKTHTDQGYQNSEKAVHVTKEIAKVIDTSHDTLHKVKTIAEKKPELLTEIDRGKKSIHSAYVIIKREEKLKTFHKLPKYPTGKYNVILADPPWKYDGIKIRAERRCGEFLQEMDKQQPGQYQQRSHDSTVAPSLKEIGITKNESSVWQQIADIPEQEFENHIEETKKNKNEFEF